jgi:RNA polymerase sigma factor (sigma-70 family)
VIHPSNLDPLLTSDGDTSLFSRHGQAIFAFARFHTPSREDARDITLEVFKIALENDNLAWLKEDEQLSWLRRVANNKIVDRYRRSKRHPLIDLGTVTDTLLDDDDNSPEAVILRRETHEQLHRAIQKLPELHQQLLRLRYGDRLPFSDIACLLNKREDALRKILSRTLARLRKSIILPQ